MKDYILHCFTRYKWGTMRSLHDRNITIPLFVGDRFLVFLIKRNVHQKLNGLYMIKSLTTGLDFGYFTSFSKCKKYK